MWRNFWLKNLVRCMIIGVEVMVRIDVMIKLFVFIL